MPESPLINAEDVEVRYGTAPPTVAGLEFAVERGDFVSLVGPSGCGKSTILRLVAGLQRPSGGRVTVGSRAADAPSNGLRRAFVFQDATLLPWRTVTQNIRLPLELEGVPRDRQDERIDNSLRLIGLTGADARKRPRQLSGGMRMRVSLARALVTEPDVLLLDEPFAALDDITRQRLNQDLQRIWCERRWTTLFVTHNVSEAVYLSRRVLVMSASPGRIAGQIEVPFESPRRPELRADPEFARLTGEVSRRLEEVSA